ncbi:DNA-binding response regulator [Rhodococcus sp. NKCM2511]|uniref:LuxR C-terminal-related transcriptional regulator n=1 Tax=Rhodococcus sp. NKCM2511 TaxID=2766011 RepID=UPI0019100851|nr:response regulator transcription factor [Rhodococcus sp. NKCM2511]GHP15427.1 DNA-binding response regulator [Rhodococcus sp. NKCM2511]
MTPGLRVVIADDDVLLREGLASLLNQAGLEVVGQAGDAEELETLVARELPASAIIDIGTPPTQNSEGLDAALRIRMGLTEIAVVLLSAHVEIDHALQLLDGGKGVGYLLATRVTDMADFVGTIDRVAGGASVIDPAVVYELVAARRRDDPLAALSSRECDVLTLMAEGLSNAGIGRRLRITEGTVEEHVRSILTKFDLAETADDHRRVRAVIMFLDAQT